MLRGKLNDLQLDGRVDAREQLLDSCEHWIGDHVLRARIALRDRQILEDDDPLIADLEREIRCGRVQGAATHSALQIDRYLEVRRRDFDAKRKSARVADPMFYQKLGDTKKRKPLSR